jgi:tRNA nucleotidyltransferase (CCA-adding enzyme)
LEYAGYSCLIVGGAVRDVLLGLEPKDFDLATNATPDEIKEVIDTIPLDGYHYVLGPQAEKSLVNLTSLVTVPNEKEAIEITTFRKELGYAGDRTKGEFIPAKTFEEDAQRRDLTINAMGMTKDGILIDPMNGKEDLENKVIRAVGDPNQRFVEDPLRMIRAIRFSTKYGMPIDPATYQAILDNVDLIPTLSAPRLRQEIGKVLVEPNGYQMLMETGILPILMPEFRNMKDFHHKLDYHPEDTLYNHYIEAFKKFTTIPNPSELGAWALLFHDIAKPQTAVWNEEGGYHTFYGHDKKGAQLILDKYNNQVGPFEFSKKELQEIAWTTEHHLGKFWESMKPMKVSTMRNDERFPRLVEVVTGDTMGIRRGGDEELQRRLKEIDEITNKVNEQKAKMGNRPKDFARKVIQELNVQGKEISMALSEIEEMVSTGQVQSYDEALEVLKTKRNA